MSPSATSTNTGIRRWITSTDITTTNTIATITTCPRRRVSLIRIHTATSPCATAIRTIPISTTGTDTDVVAPRTIFAVSVAVLLVILLLAAIAVPWYRRLPLTRSGRLLVMASAIIFLLALIASVVFLVPVYWD